MPTTAGLTEVVLYDTLVNYLVSMARTVEGAMNRALDAIVSLENSRTSALPQSMLYGVLNQRLQQQGRNKSGLCLVRDVKVQRQTIRKT